MPWAMHPNDGQVALEMGDILIGLKLISAEKSPRADED